MANKPKSLKFIGKNGNHITGIPARDLTKTDLAALTDAQIKTCIQSGLYQAPSESKENK